jgi:hypothetical protein
MAGSQHRAIESRDKPTLFITFIHAFIRIRKNIKMHSKPTYIVVPRNSVSVSLPRVFMWINVNSFIVLFRTKGTSMFFSTT